MTPCAPTVRWDTSPGQARDAGAALGQAPHRGAPYRGARNVRRPQEQETHHRAVSFQEEFRAFLARYEVEYDERYVWD